MKKFNFQLVLSINDGNQRIIFAGSTELKPNEVTSLCLDELKNSQGYVIENFIYQPEQLLKDESKERK